MNTVLLNKHILARHFENDNWALFYYNFGLSIGRMLEISNVNNVISLLLSLCEELEVQNMYDVIGWFCFPLTYNGLSLEEDNSEYMESISIGIEEN